MSASIRNQLSRLTHALSASDLLRNAINLGSGTALGQALVIAVTPLLTRLYGPYEMGLIALFMAFLLPASLGMSLRYELAIPQLADDGDADSLLALCLLMLPILALVASAAFAMLIVLGWFGYQGLPFWSVAVMWLLLVATAAFTALRFRAVRSSAFTTIGRALIAQGMGRALVPLAVAAATTTWIGLLSGEVAGRLLGVRSLAATAARPLHTAWRALDRSRALRLLRENSHCPLVFLPTTLIDALGPAAIAPAIAATYGVAAAGVFFLAHRLVLTPSGLVSASLADAYHARFIAILRRDPREVRTAVRSSAGYLLAIALAIYMPIALVAPWLVVPILGPSWSQLEFGVIALVPAAISGTVVSPVSRALVLSRIPQLRWLSDCTRSVLPLLAIVAAFQLELEFERALVLFSAATVFGDSVYLAVILYCVSAGRLRVERA